MSPRSASLPRTPRRATQAGLTLVELMVAVVLGMLVALVATSALIIARSGFTSVDATAQLRENSRFAASIIQRVALQAGFENVAKGVYTDWRRLCTAGPCGDPGGDTNPGIRGYDNAYISTASSLPGGLAHGDRTTKCTTGDTSCANGSDVLMVRYGGDGSAVGAADGSMINCAGFNEPFRADLVPAYSIFHVTRAASGEPALACSYRNPGTNAWETVVLIEGVEAMQVLYGVDNVTPATAPPTSISAEDTVAERYLRAAQLDVAGNAAATVDNWRRVRSLRIGLVIRGAVGSAVDRAASAQTFAVLGNGFTVNADTLSNLAVPADGRLRHNLVFTVHLRNPQWYVPPSSS